MARYFNDEANEQMKIIPCCTCTNVHLQQGNLECPHECDASLLPTPAPPANNIRRSKTEVVENLEWRRSIFLGSKNGNTPDGLRLSAKSESSGIINDRVGESRSITQLLQCLQDKRSVFTTVQAFRNISAHFPLQRLARSPPFHIGLTRPSRISREVQDPS